MDDRSLLVFGCAVSFIAVAGAYVFIRERFAAASESREAERSQAEKPQPLPKAG